MRKKLILLFALVLVVAACGGSSDETTTTESAAPESTTTAAPAATTTTAGETADATITIENFDFGQPLEISVGTPVTVTNADAAAHTWTSDDEVFDSGSLAQGDVFTFTFDEAGDYSFFCAIHPAMTGSISVSG